MIEALGHQPFLQGGSARASPLTTFACLRQISVDAVVNLPSCWLISAHGQAGFRSRTALTALNARTVSQSRVALAAALAALTAALAALSRGSGGSE